MLPIYGNSYLKNRHPAKLKELEESEKEANKKKAAAREVKEQASSSQATLQECLE